ncbi:MAG: glycosyltransferase family 4 protein [Oscillospiraceae bacterium]|nr:glycosyltransferase family 4 protein [Oscillospiraceae bacterium]
MPEERKKLGWGTEKKPDYVLGIAEADFAIENADIIIAGSAPEKIIQRCIRAKKLVFRYSERPFKNGPEIFKFPFRLIKWRFLNPQNVRLLSAGAFSAKDFAKFGLFKKRAYKWGYFPETVRYENPKAVFSGKDCAEILWCGRFLRWKHPEICIELAERLKNAGLCFRIKLIGLGEEEENLRRAVLEKSLSENIVFLGAMNPSEVRREMEKAGIFILTSGKREGWGAVLNEAMNSGCAVIGNSEAGAVTYLINDGENGFTYKNGADELFGKVKFLLENPSVQKRLGFAAYKTIVDSWNAKTAAKRFYVLSEKVLSGEEGVFFENGPCGKA